VRGWFRRRPLVVQPAKPDGWDDRHTAAAHSLTLTQWVALTPDQKRDARLGVAAALNERKTA
jgi:hypothetical protein